MGKSVLVFAHVFVQGCAYTFVASLRGRKLYALIYTHKTYINRSLLGRRKVGIGCWWQVVVGGERGDSAGLNLMRLPDPFEYFKIIGNHYFR